MRRRLAFFVAVLAALALGACATTGNPPAPAPAMPAAWAEPGAPDAAAPASDWWRSFGSAELSGLIDAALSASPDMAIAAEHVRQAEAQARIAGATLFPALNFSAGTGRGETRPPGGSWSGGNSSSAGLSASYELDLWGQNASAARSAEYLLRASRFDQQTIRLTLVTGVASGYFQVLSLRARLVIARENLAIAERVFKVVDARARYGAVSALDVASQQAAVLAQRAAIPPARAAGAPDAHCAGDICSWKATGSIRCRGFERVRPARKSQWRGPSRCCPRWRAALPWSGPPPAMASG